MNQTVTVSIKELKSKLEENGYKVLTRNTWLAAKMGLLGGFLAGIGSLTALFGGSAAGIVYFYDEECKLENRQGALDKNSFILGWDASQPQNGWVVYDSADEIIIRQDGQELLRVEIPENIDSSSFVTHLNSFCRDGNADPLKAALEKAGILTATPAGP